VNCSAGSGVPRNCVAGQPSGPGLWTIWQPWQPWQPWQQAFLAALEQAVSCGQASPAQQAYLEDRVRINAGLPQRFGTQFVVSAAGDRHPLPIEDPPGLAVRREAAGLPPLPTPGS
jgi:hypothetical protein